MKVKRGAGVRLKADSFGGVCYVPARDDFFACNKDVFKWLKRLNDEWLIIPDNERATYEALAKLSACQTDPPTEPISYSGPSFLGVFPEIPTVSDPLVVNCFATAHCPLSCVYCHADDLMKQFRERESDDDLDNVIASAMLVPSMVAVITGGDPLTRPHRAIRLIEALAAQKSLVLDTSGVGDFEALLPYLKRYKVHVRVSLDHLGTVNDKLRPINRLYVDADADVTSRRLAEQTIKTCVAEQIAVSVQTVVTSQNSRADELIDLRDWLVINGVRHWVLHVAVEGGSARRIEQLARKRRRSRGIVPGQAVYEELWRVISTSQRDKLPIDIRCTDTGNTPNSVLLIGSQGDLYTEGYAHKGKVLLFKSDSSRPDLARALWPHLDRFGHARRYLNWNPWFYADRSLEQICYAVPLPIPTASAPELSPDLVEVEAKFKVNDPVALRRILNSLGFRPRAKVLQVDEYYDTSTKTLGSFDYVVRVRTEGQKSKFGFKGPRFYSPDGEYSRLELELNVATRAEMQIELAKRGLTRTWIFEKRREEFGLDRSQLIVAVDEIPALGFYLELEGPAIEGQAVKALLQPALGEQERRNYRDLFVDHMTAGGGQEDEIHGAQFEPIQDT